ncbi:unnamed protein product [Effrenium voratum]|nr:unnamed protein product [Effrenium voratum]
MLLGRLVRQGASTLASRSSLSATAPNLARGFATKVYSPRPLSVRYDGLMTQCVVAALVYFVPQDVVFLGGLFYVWHSNVLGQVGLGHGHAN